MALLRNCVRLWSRSLRTHSTDAPSVAHAASGIQRKSLAGSMSRQRAMRKESHLLLNNRLKANESISREDWVSIRKELLSRTELSITESTVDMAIVYLCEDNKKSQEAMDYLEYLFDNSQEMNILSMSFYLSLCYANNATETRRKYLLAMYDRIREKYPVMESQTAENCMKAISMTDRWKEAIELLDIVKMSDEPSHIAYAVIILAAYRNNEPEIGWKYLLEGHSRRNPIHSVYVGYLDYCVRNFKGDELEAEISKIFELWADLDLRPHVDVIAEFEKVLKANGWTAARTTIRDLGSCCSCGHNMSPLEVTPQQHRKLVDAIQKSVIVGSDVFRKTTPEELQKFHSFLKRSKHYDIVIDGLNVLYVLGSGKKPDGSEVNEIVRLCVAMGKRVLVLGRKHMLRLRKLDMNFIKKHGSLFLTENMSQDDPYLLYASLCNGPDTLFVTRDLMRQHKHRITSEDPELAHIFRYWLMSRRIYPEIVQTNGKLRAQLRLPPAYLPLAQRDDNGWHVPFTDNPSTQPAVIYEPPKTWVCLRKNPNKKSIPNAARRS